MVWMIDTRLWYSVAIADQLFDSSAFLSMVLCV